MTVMRAALVVRGSSPGLPLVVRDRAPPISRLVLLWLRRGRLKPGAPDVLERRGLVCPPFTQLPSTLLLRLEGRCMHADMCLQQGLPDPPQPARCGHQSCGCCAGLATTAHRLGRTKSGSCSKQAMLLPASVGKAIPARLPLITHVAPKNLLLLLQQPDGSLIGKRCAAAPRAGGDHAHALLQSLDTLLLAGCRPAGQASQIWILVGTDEQPWSATSSGRPKSCRVAPTTVRFIWGGAAKFEFMVRLLGRLWPCKSLLALWTTQSCRAGQSWHLQHWWQPAGLAA